MFDVKKLQMFELILGQCQLDLDPDPVFKILICWIRIRSWIRLKMDRIRNPAGYTVHNTRMHHREVRFE